MLRLNELTNLLTDTSRQHPDNYVLLIDEMGRGDTARIFGELITLIESDKRAGASNAMSAVLPLSGERFDVPANLYLIGTLNSADATRALRDHTLRRRFEFEELMPDASLIRGDDQLGTIPDGNGGRIDLRALMDTINRRIDFMVGREKTLGHAFFMHIRTFEDLLRSLHHQVIPQLREILEGDWYRIQLIFKDVLGDGRANRPQIVAHEWQTSASVLGVSHEDIDDQIRFWITAAHELTPEALRKVYHES
jgi:5-methylcytosine-specific restriction protein B